LSELTGTTELPRACELPLSLDVSLVHRDHADFVWASLQRLGVRDADLEDMLQEVFVVVHRRLHTFDTTTRLTTWLFGIAMRVAAGYRRRAHIRRERSVPEIEETVEPGDGPVELAERRQAQERLHALLDSLDLEKRAVFVMFEIDELSCDTIAEILGTPVGTVYSRLHAARKAFQKALARMQAREAR
jgi:RNA polymerase sigma-70 factor (ECF subfamily)